MQNYAPSLAKVELFLKSQGLYKLDAMTGERWEVQRLENSTFSHVLKQVGGYSHRETRPEFYVNENMCIKKSLDDFSHDYEYEDLSAQWQKCE